MLDSILSVIKIDMSDLLNITISPLLVHTMIRSFEVALILSAQLFFWLSTVKSVLFIAGLASITPSIFVIPVLFATAIGLS